MASNEPFFLSFLPFLETLEKASVSDPQLVEYRLTYDTLDQDTFEIFHKSLACSTAIGGIVGPTFGTQPITWGSATEEPEPKQREIFTQKVLKHGQVQLPLGLPVFVDFMCTNIRGAQSHLLFEYSTSRLPIPCKRKLKVKVAQAPREISGKW